MVRRSTLRHALAATLAAVLIPIQAFGQIVYGPFILRTGIDAPDGFVTLAESTTFGPGGTIADLTNRFAVPVYIPIQTDFSGWTENTSLKDAGCSTDETTWTALKNAITAAADNTRIWLPDDCKVLAFVSPGNGDGVEYSIPATKDGLALWCDDPSICGIEGRYRAGIHPTDYTVGNVYGPQISRRIFSVGSSTSSAIQTCNWTGGYGIGTKKIQTDCTMSDSGGSEWGAGDIVRLKTSDITGFGTNDPSLLYRVTCVRFDDSTMDPASDPDGSLCGELDADNQIQISDPLPMDYGVNTYYWGLNSGSSFTDYGGGSGTYADTTGHTVEQIERVGNGTRTDQIAEDIYFMNIGWSFYPEFIGGSYIRFLDVYNAQVADNLIDGRVGAQSAFTTGGAAGPGEASHVSFHSNIFNDGAYKTTCYAEITEIEIIDANTLGITYNSTGSCNFANGGGDDSAAFTSDVDEPMLAGKSMLKTASTVVSTNPFPERRRFTVDVTSTVGANECDDAGADSCEGLAIDLDKYDNGIINCNDRSSGVQVVNNAFINTTQGPVLQNGCTQFAWVANYTYHDTDHRTGRGPFLHGNNESAGHIIEMNDSDQSYSVIQGSNRAPTSHGECIACTWYKNRCTKSAATAAPQGGDYSTRGTCFDQSAQNQWGASNEDWTMVLNVGSELYDGATKTDEASNLPDTADGVNNAPHMIYDLYYYRNRCVGSGCNQDDNFDTANTSTDTDIEGHTGGTNSAGTLYEDDDVPVAWASEVGEEPTSLFFTSKPEFWCNEAVTFGQIGAYYDDYNGGTIGKLPAQIRYEGTTCTPP